MKHNFSLLSGNSVRCPRHKNKQRALKWLWHLFTAAFLAVAALELTGAWVKPTGLA